MGSREQGFRLGVGVDEKQIQLVKVDSSPAAGQPHLPPDHAAPGGTQPLRLVMGRPEA